MGSSQRAGEMARQFAELTGVLSPPERTEEFGRARRLIAHSRLGDTASTQRGSGSAAEPTEAMRLIATEATSGMAEEAQRTKRVVRREESAAPSNASETPVPFFTAVRSGVWFDLFQKAVLCRRR